MSTPQYHWIENGLARVARLRYRSALNKLNRSPKPRVLFCVNSQLMYTYVDRVWRAYVRREDYDVYVSVSYPYTRRLSCWGTMCALKKRARQDGYTYLPAVLAARVWWHLFMAAEPTLLEKLRAGRRLMTDHSIIGFKRYGDDWYPYLNNYVYDEQGGFRFDAVLEASPLKYKYVTERDRRLTDLIELVGSLHADDLLARNAQRSEIRARMGYERDDIVLLVQSTFRESLIEDLGLELLGKCEALADTGRYKICISLHPNLWEGPYAAKHPWGRIASRYEREGLAVRRPTDDLMDGLIAADIALTDHTSLCVNYALLGKPMVFYMPRHGFQTADVLAPLLALYPEITQVGELEGALQSAWERHDSEKLAATIDQFVGFRNEAAPRINAVLDRLLLESRSHDH